VRKYAERRVQILSRHRLGGILCMKHTCVGLGVSGVDGDSGESRALNGRDMRRLAETSSR
jgi:hypothetical protein